MQVKGATVRDAVAPSQQGVKVVGVLAPTGSRTPHGAEATAVSTTAAASQCEQSTSRPIANATRGGLHNGARVDTVGIWMERIASGQASDERYACLCDLAAAPVSTQQSRACMDSTSVGLSHHHPLRAQVRPQDIASAVWFRPGRLGLCCALCKFSSTAQFLLACVRAVGW